MEAHKKEVVPCMGCDEQSNARCLECQENYCDDHARFHSIVAATKHHTVLRFTDILAEPQKILRANGAQVAYTALLVILVGDNVTFICKYTCIPFRVNKQTCFIQVAMLVIKCYKHYRYFAYKLINASFILITL